MAVAWRTVLADGRAEQDGVLRNDRRVPSKVVYVVVLDRLAVDGDRARLGRVVKSFQQPNACACPQIESSVSRLVI